MFLNHCSAWHIWRCLHCDNLFALSALHKHFGAHFTRLTKRFPPQNSLLHSGSAGPVDQKSRRFGKFVVSRVFSGIETVRNVHRGQAWASYVRSKTHKILMQIQKVVTTLGNNMMICATLESSSIQKILAQVTTVATTENVCAKDINLYPLSVAPPHHTKHLKQPMSRLRCQWRPAWLWSIFV